MNSFLDPIRIIPPDKHVAIKMQDIVSARTKHPIEVAIEWTSTKIFERWNNPTKEIVCDVLSCLLSIIDFYNTAIGVVSTQLFEEIMKRPNILMPSGRKISPARLSLNSQHNLRNLVLKSLDLMWRKMRSNW